MNDEIQILEAGPEDYDAAPLKISSPLYVPDEWPILFIDHEKARFWCELDEDFYPEALSDITGFNHPVSFDISESGLATTMDWNSWPSLNEIKTAIACGLTYRQPFLIEMNVHYYQSHGPDGSEWDCNVDWEILQIKPLPQNVIIERFQEWLNR